MIEWLFSQLEPAIEEMPGTVSHRGKTHRRLPDKTLRSDIVTRFGKISLCVDAIAAAEPGRMIFPLEILLGIENGFTPAAADRIGKQFASLRELARPDTGDDRRSDGSQNRHRETSQAHRHARRRHGTVSRKRLKSTS